MIRRLLEMCLLEGCWKPRCEDRPLFAGRIKGVSIVATDRTLDTGSKLGSQ